MKKLLGLFILLLVIIPTALFALTSHQTSVVSANECKHLNSECTINQSGSNCCAGLVCVPFNGHSGNGKCGLAPTATPTPTVVPSVTPTETPSPTPSCEGEDCVTPTPTPTIEVTPTPTLDPNLSPDNVAGSSGTPAAPTCTTGETLQLPANPFVVRSGSQATVNFFITQGDSANIYYRVVGSSDWQYSVIDVKPNGDGFVSYTISDLDPRLGYEFGIQQKFGCGSGQLVTAVVVDGPESRVFTFSYWEWSK